MHRLAKLADVKSRGVYDLRRSLSCTSIWGNIIRATEHLESWVALNAITLAEVGLLCTVNLGKLDILLLQCSRRFFVFWCECFAVTTIQNISNLVRNRCLRKNLPPGLD
jgi:hypothetical protein